MAPRSRRRPTRAMTRDYPEVPPQQRHTLQLPRWRPMRPRAIAPIGSEQHLGIAGYRASTHARIEISMRLPSHDQTVINGECRFYESKLSCDTSNALSRQTCFGSRAQTSNASLSYGPERHVMSAAVLRQRPPAFGTVHRSNPKRARVPGRDVPPPTPRRPRALPPRGFAHLQVPHVANTDHNDG